MTLVAREVHAPADPLDLAQAEDPDGVVHRPLQVGNGELHVGDARRAHLSSSGVTLPNVTPTDKHPPRMTPPRLLAMADHVDVLIVGAGLSGIGAACHLQARSRPDVRDPRGARRDRRHLGPVPLPRRPLGLGHVHARLPRSGRGRGDKAIADGAVDPALRRATPRARHGIDRHIRFGHRVVRAAWSSDDGALDGRRRAADTASSTAAASSSARAATTATTRATRRLRRASSDFGGDGRAPAVLAGGPRLRGQAGRRDRQRRDRGDARARDGRAGRARHDAAALADLHPLVPGTDPIANALRACCRARARLRDHALEEHRAARPASTSSAGAARSSMRKAHPRTAAKRSCRRATTSTRTSSRATTRGTSGCAWCPTATCSRRSAHGDGVDRHRHDRALHRARDPAAPPARSSRPTSSSPRPG